MAGREGGSAYSCLARPKESLFSAGAGWSATCLIPYSPLISPIPRTARPRSLLSDSSSFHKIIQTRLRESVASCRRAPMHAADLRAAFKTLSYPFLSSSRPVPLLYDDREPWEKPRTNPPNVRGSGLIQTFPSDGCRIAFPTYVFLLRVLRMLFSKRHRSGNEERWGLTSSPSPSLSSPLSLSFPFCSVGNCFPLRN